MKPKLPKLEFQLCWFLAGASQFRTRSMGITTVYTMLIKSWLWYLLICQGTSFGKMNRKLNWCCELSSMYRPNWGASPRFSWNKGSRSKARYCPQLQSCAIHAEHALLQVFPHNRSLWLHWHLAVVISWLWLDPCKVPQLDLASLNWTLPWTVLCHYVTW